MPANVTRSNAYPVGYMPLKNFHLGDTAAPVPACAWYPAAQPGPQPLRRYGGSFLAHASSGAPFAAGLPPGPLVLLVHGLRGTLSDLSWLGEICARAGLLAVAFEQPGVCHRDFDAAVAPRLWRRAEQIRAAIDWVGAHGILRSMITGHKVLLAGHSAGASAAFVAAGAHISPARFAARYPDSGPVPAPVPADPRIGGVLALAPGTGEVFDDGGIAQAQAPALIYSGQRDLHCPDARNAARYAAHLPQAQWHRLPRAGHFAFKPCCSWYGKLRAPAICLDAWGVRRAALHARIGRDTLTFLASAGLLPSA